MHALIVNPVFLNMVCQSFILGLVWTINNNFVRTKTIAWLITITVEGSSP